MKQLRLFMAMAMAMSFLLLASCQKKPNSIIIGEIKNCEDCEVKLVFLNLSASYYQDINQTTVKNGKFYFRERIKQPGVYQVFHHDTRANSSFSAKIYLPADTVRVLFDRTSNRPKLYEELLSYSQLRSAAVKSTSSVQQELDRFLQIQDSLEFKFVSDRELTKAKFEQTFDSGDNKLIQQWADSLKSFDQKYGSYMAKASEFFVQTHPNSEVALYAIIQSNNNGQDVVKNFRPYYTALPEERKNSIYGKVLGDLIKREGKRKKNNQHLLGHRVDYLTGATPQQAQLDAAAIFKQNKLTLVEFWASWCSPCRWEMPKYHALYQKHRKKGFDMIAVSIDDNYQKWTKAIAQDSIYVHHLSELKGLAGKDVKRFNVQLIPFNLLVDASGKVVAADLDAEELKIILQRRL